MILSRSCRVLRVDGQRAYLRIGELARRTGVTPEVLRAWELRYELLHPARSEGGFRLYSDEDERRVRRTTALIADGLSAAQAARLALAEGAEEVGEAPGVEPVVAELAGELAAALDSLDGEAAHAAFDRMLAVLSVEAVMRQILLPYLRELGERWEAGQATVAQEHFASSLIRGRLLGLARGWGAGEGPRVALACPSGERHDIGLVMFGIAIARRGWRVAFFGADTPAATLQETIRGFQPALIVLSVATPARVRSNAAAIRGLGSIAPVAIGGRVTEREAVAVGGTALLDDPITAARRVVGGAVALRRAATGPVEESPGEEASGEASGRAGRRVARRTPPG